MLVYQIRIFYLFQVKFMQNRLISDCFESHFGSLFPFIFILDEKIYLLRASSLTRQITKYDCSLFLIFQRDFLLKLFLISLIGPRYN